MAEAEGSLAEHKMRMVKAEIASKRALDPKLSFVAAWNRLRSERPELFEQAAQLEQSGEDEPLQQTAKTRAAQLARERAVKRITSVTSERGEVITCVGGFATRVS